MPKGTVFSNDKTAERVAPTRGVGGPFAGRDRSGPESDLRNADARIIVAAIAIACSADVLLTIGGAKGGVGHMVSVYDGKQQHKDYSHNIEELHALLWRVMEYYASPSEDWEQAYGLEGLRS